MKACLSLVLLPMTIVCACSSNNPGTDAGADAGGTDAPADVAANDTGTDASGCGSMQGSATVSGTLLGNTLIPKDSVYNSGGGTPFVIITDWAGTCALGLNTIKQNGSGLLFDFLNTPTLTPGKIDVGTNLDVQYATYDQTCNSPTGESSTSGSVTLTKVDACGVTGTYDVILNSDHVSGTFTAPNCDNAGDGGQTCAP